MKLKLGGKMHQAVALPPGDGVESGASSSKGGSLSIQTPAARNSAAAPLEDDSSGSEDEWEPGFLAGQQRVQRSGGSGDANLRRGASGGQQRQEEIDRLDSNAFGSEFAAPL